MASHSLANRAPIPKRPKTAGRKRGISKAEKLRNAVFEAFDLAGGVEYLVQCAKDEPKTFLQLLGKVMPKQVDVSHTHTVTLEESIRGAFQQIEPPKETEVIDVQAEVHADQKALDVSKL